MTGFAGATCQQGMVRFSRRGKRSCIDVASIARKRGNWHMVGNNAFSGFAVTISTSTWHNTRMVKGRSYKRCGVFMASFTARSSCKVSRRFCFHIRVSATVACRTASHNASVIHHRTYKAGSTSMTGIALHTGWDMCSRFTHSAATVMAVSAACGDASMVHAGWNPRCRAVTSVARHACHNMRGRLAFCGCAVMASRTTTHRHTRVVHGSWRKRYGRFMTSLATHTRWDMCSGLAFSGCAIMASCTACHDARMIKRRP